MADERKAHLKSQSELELLRVQHEKLGAKHAKDEKAEQVAAREGETAKSMMLRLKMQEEAMKKESEKRLASLLAEQRASFEQTMRIVRTEADQKLKGFAGRIHELEANLKAAQLAKYEALEQLQRATSAVGPKAPEAQVVGGGAISADMMRAAAKATGRKPSKPGAKMMYSEMRILARKAREEARDISIVDHLASGASDSPFGNKGGQSPGRSGNSPKSGSPDSSRTNTPSPVGQRRGSLAVPGNDRQAGPPTSERPTDVRTPSP